MIESTPGEGTSVSIFLPALAYGAPVQARPTASPAPAAVGKALRVLLVEDDSAVLATLREQLALSGWEVIEAQDGKAALSLVESDPSIAALVSDVMMPGGVNGVDLARLAVQARPGLPVVLISGHTGAALTDNGAIEGEFELLAKPFTHVQLVERIRAAIAAHQAGARPTPIEG